MKLNVTVTIEPGESGSLLEYLMKKGYAFRVTPVNETKSHAPAAAAPPVTAPTQKVYPTPKKRFIPVKNKSSNRSRFDHPSGKTSTQFAMEYLKSMGTTTTNDLAKYIQSLGFSKSTAWNVISKITTSGMVEVEGIYLGTKSGQK